MPFFRNLLVGIGLCLMVFILFIQFSPTPEASQSVVVPTGEKNLTAHVTASKVLPADPADKELQTLLRTVKKQPNDLDTLTRLGHAYFDRQDYGQAITTYQQVLKKQPQNAVVLTDLGTAYFYRGKTQLALEKYQAAIQAKPEHVDAYFNSGFVYTALGQPEKAKEVWSQALKIDSSQEFKGKVTRVLKELEQNPALVGKP